MLITFYLIFYIAICAAIKNPRRLTDAIFKHSSDSDKDAIGEKEATWVNVPSLKTSVEKIPRVKNGAEIEQDRSKPELGRKERFPLLLSEIKDGDEVERVSKRERKDVEEPSYPPLYVINNPEHVGDGARLRFDFVRPGGNGSCPNFRGTAEVIAGKWQLPGFPVPEALGPGEDLPPEYRTESEASEPTTTTQSTTTSTTTAKSTTSKKPGFFKGVEDFFRRSFHIDKTTTPLESTTKKTSSQLPEVTSGSLISPLISPENISIARGQEDLEKVRAPKVSKIKTPSRGREATFNLRIKAVAIPRLKET